MYLTLPSNSSLDIFPDNTLATFKVKLPKRIELTGDWEVGVVDVHYPISWYNITGTHNKISVITNPNEASDFYIPPGYYEAHDLVQTLRTFNNPEKQTAQFHQVLMEHHIEEEFFEVDVNKVTNKLEFKIKEPLTFKLSPIVALTLGSTKKYIRGSGVMENQINLHQKYPTLYIYSDITENRIVGDAHVPLLATIPVRGHQFTNVAWIADKVHYHPLRVNSFDTVEISINTDTGESFPFQYGKVLITLHLRRKRKW